jgi:hypothetical protein
VVVRAGDNRHSAVLLPGHVDEFPLQVVHH